MKGYIKKHYFKKKKKNVFLSISNALSAFLEKGGGENITKTWSLLHHISA